MGGGEVLKVEEGVIQYHGKLSFSLTPKNPTHPAPY